MTAMRDLVKRTLDLVLATVGLVVLAPVMTIIALAIRWRMGSPVVFRQTRLGKDGEPFTLLKFRTMTEQRDEDRPPLTDAERLTRLGRVLRSSSLDELPELLIVLRGDMALVGPRPLLPEYRDLYTPFQWRRHEVRPGIAGPVVIRGRNRLDWQSKFELDVWYVDNWTLLTDLKILGLTVWKALTRDGVSQPGQATVEFFQGSKSK